MAKFITEDDIEQSILQMLKGADFQYDILCCDPSPDKKEDLNDGTGRSAKTECILPRVLEESLCRINPKIPAEKLTSVIKDLTADFSDSDLVSKNYELYNKIRNYIKIPILKKGKEDFAFVKLIDNPKFGKKNDGFINELIANSPKTEEAVLKLSERDNVLCKFGLDYRSDYICNDSKYIDIVLMNLGCLRAFCLYGTELVFKILCLYLKLQSDKARLGFANMLWSDYHDLVSFYQCKFEARQEVFNEAMEVYQSTMDDVRDVYYDSKKAVDKKYKNIEKYKELIKSGQLPVFKKK